ncbi:MocR-like pyridoxine biosynthesis transcription factor PdxR [Asaia astilbis]|uniref:MocR-like pyridoxine biosynthesis transcription factor PdxR n=1 Tax=Asaia astilbis TaxID=610244 RepID=UPI0006850C07|nr:PLP-dependent aminotransferase family protein [Asaia astilbis]
MPVYLPAFCHPDPCLADTLPVQVFAALGGAIRAGRISHGAVLPSTRHAATMLGLSRASLSTAYDLLRAEGLIEMRPGCRPTARLPAVALTGSSETMLPALSQRGIAMACDPRSAGYLLPSGRLTPGMPDEAVFPADLWAQILRRQTRLRHGDESGYVGYHGAARLRAVLCARLASDRGLSISPDQILITSGTQASLSLITQLMTDPGDVVALEDPGYLGARAAFLACGARIHPVPVDEQGMQVEALPSSARLIYITPSNQFPLGGRMGLDRRLALLKKAREQGALILEDDYDSEFLWHGREIAALAAHDAATSCLYLGSASKSLLPGLRIGWMAVPKSLVEPLRAALRTAGCAANLHAQYALAELMESGHYRRHLRRISRLYHQRGQALHDALHQIPGLASVAPSGGVQMALTLTSKGQEQLCQAALAKAGYRAARLSALCLNASQEGLVIGFAALRPDDPDRIATILRDALSQAIN